MFIIDDLAQSFALPNELVPEFHFANVRHRSLLPWQPNSQRISSDAICPGRTLNSSSSIACQKRAIESARGDLLPVISTIRRCVRLFDSLLQDRARTVNKMWK